MFLFGLCPVLVAACRTFRLFSYGPQAQQFWPECERSCSRACRILVPWPVIKPASSALQGGLLIPGPPGKAHYDFIKGCNHANFQNQYLFLFFDGYKLMCMLSRFSHVWIFATLWTIACQAPLSMGFSKQESWSELPCSPPGNLPNPGTGTHISYISSIGGRGSLPLVPTEKAHKLVLLGDHCQWTYKRDQPILGVTNHPEVSTTEICGTKSTPRKRNM